LKRLIPYVGLLAVGFVILAAVGRVWWDGNRAMKAGEAALAEGEVVAAQNHFLTAGRSFVPLIGYHGDGIQALLALGDDYLAKGRWPEAVAAYDDARGALYATVWIGYPDDVLLTAADTGYAKALAAWKLQRDSSTDIAAAEARYLEIASSVETPSGFWALVMGLSFICYVGCLAMLAWRWDHAAARRWPWLVGAGGGFALWILALLLV
jgi:hypothetical protein